MSETNSNQWLKKSEYIYLLKKNDPDQNNKQIYKINHRKHYINSNLEEIEQFQEIFIFAVQNSIQLKSIIIDKLLINFNHTFKQYKNIGDEYFGGSEIDLIKIILEMINKSTILVNRSAKNSLSTYRQGYLYLVMEREFINSNQNIYKIGRTGQYPYWKRMNGYPKNSILILAVKINNYKKVEILIKERLMNTNGIDHLTDIGQEYFGGNLGVISTIFLEIAENLTYLEDSLQNETKIINSIESVNSVSTITPVNLEILRSENMNFNTNSDNKKVPKCTCPHCSAPFSHKSNLTRHLKLKRCPLMKTGKLQDTKSQKDIDIVTRLSELGEINKLLIEKLTQMEKKIDDRN